MAKQQLIEQLFNNMGQLRKLFESHAHESHEERAATIMQYSALKCLNHTRKSTVGEMAIKLRLSKSSATQLIERLVKAGFVTRIHDEKDRRIVRLSITPSGEAHLVDLKKKFIAKMGKVLANIPDSDLEEMLRIQAKIIETLQSKQK